MVLVPFTGTVTIGTLRANFDDATTQISTNSTLGEKDFEQFVRVASLTASSTAPRDTSIAFTPRDDALITAIMVSGTASGILTLSATLAVDSDDAYHTFLAGQTIATSVTTAGAGATTGRTGYYTASGIGNAVVRALQGVRYRLTVSTSAGAVTNACAVVQMRSRRRRA